MFFVVDVPISEFKNWLLSLRVSEATYRTLMREGFHEPVMFPMLRPETVARLEIRPLAQEVLIQEIVGSFSRTPGPGRPQEGSNSMYILLVYD